MDSSAKPPNPGAILDPSAMASAAAPTQPLARAGDASMHHLAILAHEIRNPLAAIRNAVTALTAQEVSVGTAIRARRIIDRQLTLVMQVVDEVLERARSAIHTFPIRKEPVHLGDIVWLAIEACQPVIDAGGHRILLRLPSGPLLLDGDPTRLTQMLVNLLHNAAKYSKRGGAIVLGVKRRDKHWIISVQDNGVGIDSEELPRLFGPNSPPMRPTDPVRGGLGIGLSLVKQIVESHGGSVEAHSNGVGSGSVFVVRLPVP
jgi:signal transduction histidine kinase